MYKAYTCVRLRGYLKTYIQLAQEWHMEGKLKGEEVAKSITSGMPASN